MAELDDPETLVSAAWLAARLGQPGLVVLDASWHLPGSGRDGRTEFAAGHIPGAQFWDIDEGSDPDSPLPHMEAPPARFAALAGGMGIGDATQVVVYDGLGIFSAARIWWLFRRMGHAQVAVLDGGLPAWIAAGGALSAEVPAPVPVAFTPRPALAGIITLDELRALPPGTALLDARPSARFEGAAPEPRPGLASGHIPGARNLVFKDLLTPDGRMRPLPELAAAFAARGAAEGPLVTTCGSGVSAAILYLAAHRLGRRELRLYDGSWAEWGSRPDLPVATGPA